jgi:hypothetical protein
MGHQHQLFYLDEYHSTFVCEVCGKLDYEIDFEEAVAEAQGE